MAEEREDRGKKDERKAETKKEVPSWLDGKWGDRVWSLVVWGLVGLVVMIAAMLVAVWTVPVIAGGLIVALIAGGKTMLQIAEKMSGATFSAIGKGISTTTNTIQNILRTAGKICMCAGIMLLLVVVFGTVFNIPFHDLYQSITAPDGYKTLIDPSQQSKVFFVQLMAIVLALIVGYWVVFRPKMRWFFTISCACACCVGLGGWMVSKHYPWVGELAKEGEKALRGKVQLVAGDLSKGASVDETKAKSGVKIQLRKTVKLYREHTLLQVVDDAKKGSWWVVEPRKKVQNKENNFWYYPAWSLDDKLAIPNGVFRFYDIEDEVDDALGGAKLTQSAKPPVSTKPPSSVLIPPSAPPATPQATQPSQPLPRVILPKSTVTRDRLVLQEGQWVDSKVVTYDGDTIVVRPNPATYRNCSGVMVRSGSAPPGYRFDIREVGKEWVGVATFKGSNPVNEPLRFYLKSGYGENLTLDVEKTSSS